MTSFKLRSKATHERLAAVLVAAGATVESTSAENIRQVTYVRTAKAASAWLRDALTVIITYSKSSITNRSRRSVIAYVSSLGTPTQYLDSVIGITCAIESIQRIENREQKPVSAS